MYSTTMTEYISMRRFCADKIREDADSIERVVRATGFARTAGGIVALVAGVASLAGILLAPVTASASLSLTVIGKGGGVASAATTLAAAIIKDVNVKKIVKTAKSSLDSLGNKNEVVCKIIEELKEKVKELRWLYGEKSVKEFFGDCTKIALWIKSIGYNIGYKGYLTVSSSLKTAVQVDAYAMRNFAKEMSAPGFNLLGKTLILAGSTTAKWVNGAFSVVGIGFGIWAIVGGAMDINGSKHAKAYREAAEELDKETD